MGICARQELWSSSFISSVATLPLMKTHFQLQPHILWKEGVTCRWKVLRLRGAGGICVQGQNRSIMAQQTYTMPKDPSPVFYLQRLWGMGLCSHRWAVMKNCPLFLSSPLALGRDIMSYETGHSIEQNHCRHCKPFASTGHPSHSGNQKSPQNSQMPRGCQYHSQLSTAWKRLRAQTSRADLPSELTLDVDTVWYQGTRCPRSS